ncbi:MAG TPA: hypothetical protein VH143_01120 [Kofleriaceae bacterium]|nr:hypothetical protein [Kofleriaceae bacterium]
MSTWVGRQLVLCSAVAACNGHHVQTVDAAEVSDADVAGSDAIAMGSACPPGATLVVDRTSCPGAIVTPPSFAAAQTGDVISLDGLDEGALPCLSAVVCAPAGAATMVFSDSPESPSSDGVLYADTFGPGRARLYVYHVDADTNPRKFPIVALNPGAADAHVTIMREGLAAPSTDYIDVGKAVAAAWSASNESTIVTVPAGTRVVLDAALDAEHATTNQLVHAIVDVEADAPIKFSIVSVLASEDAAAVTASLPLLPKDADHDRGTFSNADLMLAATSTDTAASARHIRLGDGTTEPELTGTDATTGLAATLHGNYGVAYHVNATASGAIAFAASARGGAWAGAYNAVAIPAASGGLSTTTDAIWLGGATTFTVVSGGGSSLPVDLLSIAQP